jgi:hypothetical protein
MAIPNPNTFLTNALSCLRRWIHVEQKNLHGQTQGNVWTLEVSLPRTTLASSNPALDSESLWYKTCPVYLEETTI